MYDEIKRLMFYRPRPKASDAAPRRGRVYDLPTGTVSLWLAVDSARTAAGRSTMPARQSGTRCLMNLEILTVLIVLNGSW